MGQGEWGGEGKEVREGASGLPKAAEKFVPWLF